MFTYDYILNIDIYKIHTFDTLLYIYNIRVVIIFSNLVVMVLFLYYIIND